MSLSKLKKVSHQRGRGCRSAMSLSKLKKVSYYTREGVQGRHEPLKMVSVFSNEY